MTSNSAQSLIGLELEGGWKVVAKLSLGASTGGYFSVSYQAKNTDGRTAFLKALDFSGAQNEKDKLGALKMMIDAFVFERDLLLKCQTRRMDRIVTAIGHGQIAVNGFIPPFNEVYYLLFEQADGDIRNALHAMSAFDLAWCFRTLHNVAVGIKQLHGNDIVHQDLKPSNVLSFPALGAKISDLGTASDMEVVSANDSYRVPGDQTYAPPELYYMDVDTRTFDARKTADLFLFGNLIFFFFTGLPATQLVALKLRNGKVSILGKSFSEDLPYFQKAFADALEDLRTQARMKAGGLGDEVVELAQQLCEPDPSFRGDPKQRNTLMAPHDLQRIISKLDILGRKARLG